MRRLTTLFAALALVLAGCGDDDDTAATSSTTADEAVTTTEATSTSTSEASTSSTSSTTTSTSTATAPDDSTVELAASCDSPDGFTISYPQDWGAVSDCGQFGPEPIDEPAPATDERTGVVSAFIDAVPYEQVAEPTEGDRDRREATVDGRPAVRVEGQVAGPSLYPEGTEYVRWLVDVTDGGSPATLFVDAYDLGFDVEFDRAVRVLDAMVASVDIDDR